MTIAVGYKLIPAELMIRLKDSWNLFWPPWQDRTRSRGADVAIMGSSERSQRSSRPTESSRGRRGEDENKDRDESEKRRARGEEKRSEKRSLSLDAKDSAENGKADKGETESERQKRKEKERLREKARERDKEKEKETKEERAKRKAKEAMAMQKSHLQRSEGTSKDDGERKSRARDTEEPDAKGDKKRIADASRRARVEDVEEGSAGTRDLTKSELALREKARARSKTARATSIAPDALARADRTIARKGDTQLAVPPVANSCNLSRSERVQLAKKGVDLRDLSSQTIESRSLSTSGVWAFLIGASGTAVADVLS